MLPQEPPKHQPALDLKLAAEGLDIGNQVPGGVLAQFGVGTAPAATPLVEQDDPVAAGIEEAAWRRVPAPARTAVQEHHGLALWIAALLEIHLVQPGNGQVARSEWLQGGIQRSARHGPFWHFPWGLFARPLCAS